MTAKEYLSQIRICDINIRQREQELAELEAEIYNISAVDTSKERVMGGKGLDITDCIGKCVDLKAEIQKAKTELLALKNRIIGEIQAIRHLSGLKAETKALYINILYMRYVDNKGLEDIAEELNYDYGYIRHKHGWALKCFDEKVLKNIKPLPKSSG